MTELNQIAETINRISADVLKATGAALRPHGEHPNAAAIAATGLFHAIIATDEVDPTIPEIVRQMLNRRAAEMGP